MKKVLTAAVVLVLLLVAAPWGIGMLAERRVNSGLEQVVETAPYLTIVEQKFDRGWFSSEQEVTFEVFGPWLRSMRTHALPQSAEQAQPETPVGDAAADAPPEIIVGTGSPDGSADEAPPAAAPEAILPPSIEPLKFTVRNHILHGPVLWFSGLGVARVDSHLVIPEQVRAELAKVFGEKSPVRISTRVRFFGGGTTTISGDARELSLPGEGRAVSYDGFKFRIGYSAHLDEVDVDGGWPRIEIRDSASGQNMLIKGITITGASHRVRGSLYDGDFKLSVDQARVAGADKDVTEVAGLHYILDSTIDDDFMDVAFRFGSGAIRSKAIEQLGVRLEEVHYDFTVRRLHLETMERMMKSMKEAYARPLASTTDIDAALTQPMKEYGLELLKHDPEFVIDRIGATTADGDAYLKGIIKLRGVNEQDLAAGAMGLVPKMEADINFQLAQSLIKKLPNGPEGLATALDQGYVKLEGSNVVSHLEFKRGALKINGKQQGIPGLGGPPQPAAPQE
jgi:uncharacterized protein YdgA (DUF945 family)